MAVSAVKPRADHCQCHLGVLKPDMLLLRSQRRGAEGYFSYKLLCNLKCCWNHGSFHLLVIEKRAGFSSLIFQILMLCPSFMPCMVNGLIMA